MDFSGRLRHALNPAPAITDGNRLSLLNNGAAYFPVLLNAITSAQQSIRLETYLGTPTTTSARR